MLLLDKDVLQLLHVSHTLLKVNVYLILLEHFAIGIVLQVLVSPELVIMPHLTLLMPLLAIPI